MREGRFSRLLIAFTCLMAAGCGRSEPIVPPAEPPKIQLQSVLSAYFSAARKLQRPPKSTEDLLPFLKKEEEPLEIAKDKLRSPFDGENYVIVWGVDIDRLIESKVSPYVVIAYEKHGQSGKRHVGIAPNYVTQMSDAEFKKAQFPPGHQPEF